MPDMGKHIRLSRLFKNGRSVMVPLDDGLISGPEQGLRNPIRKVEEIASAQADAVLGFKGMFKATYQLLTNVGMVVNLTASSTLSIHTRKSLIGEVEEALQLGFDAVAVHVNVSSCYESEMLRHLGVVSRECERLGMPLLALMYPRRESENGSDENYLDLKRTNRNEYAQLVRHAVRIGVELGADIIKTQYTGDPESFSSVIESCYGTPVVIAGGPLLEINDILEVAHGAMVAGAAGVCFGRNTYNRKDTIAFIKLLHQIIHQGVIPSELKADD